MEQVMFFSIFYCAITKKLDLTVWKARNLKTGTTHWTALHKSVCSVFCVHCENAEQLNIDTEMFPHFESLKDKQWLVCILKNIKHAHTE